MYNSRKRKSIFELCAPKFKKPRFDNYTNDVPSFLEVLFSMKHIKENIMRYGGSIFKQCQILDNVNKRMQSLVEDSFINNTKIKIRSDEVYDYFINSNFQRQYRNVNIYYDYNSKFVEKLKDKLRDINSLKISNFQSITTHIRFTEGKWSELLCLEVTGEKNGIVLDNIPDSVIHLRITNSSNRFHLPSKTFDIHLPPKLETLRVSQIEPNNPTFFPQTLQKLSVLEGCKTSFHTDIKLLNMKKLYLHNSNVLVLQSNFPVLTHLSINGDFNQKIDNLPNTLVYLCVTGAFNQSVDNLPASISHLMFDGEFNHPINKLPHSLTYLHISGDFCQPIDSLPSDLKYLWLFCNIEHEITNLPALKSLTISTASEKTIFPSTLETLVHNNQFHEDNFLLLKDSGCLRRLTMNVYFAMHDIHIPNGVNNLQLMKISKQPQVYYFPTSLEKCYSRAWNTKTTIYPQDWNTKVKINEVYESFDDWKDHFYIEFA